MTKVAKPSRGLPFWETRVHWWLCEATSRQFMPMQWYTSREGERRCCRCGTHLPYDRSRRPRAVPWRISSVRVRPTFW